MVRQFLLILLTFVVLNCQFIQAQTGHDPDEPEEGVLQMMPWAFFRHMTASDLRASYETCVPFRMRNLESAAAQVSRFFGITETPNSRN
jgi:hypothetical protein